MAQLVARSVRDAEVARSSRVTQTIFVTPREVARDATLEPFGVQVGSPRPFLLLVFYFCGIIVDVKKCYE